MLRQLPETHSDPRIMPRPQPAWTDFMAMRERPGVPFLPKHQDRAYSEKKLSAEDMQPK